MSSTKPFEVKNTKTICIRESELYKAIKSLSLFFIIWFSKKVQKTKKITKNKKQQQQQKQRHTIIIPSYRGQPRLLADYIDQNTNPHLCLCTIVPS